MRALKTVACSIGRGKDLVRAYNPLCEFTRVLRGIGLPGSATVLDHPRAVRYDLAFNGLLGVGTYPERRFMAVLEILSFPHPVLRKRAKPVDRIDDEIHRLARDMTHTMYQAPGIGLAAPQVGVPQRLIVVDLSAGERPDERIVVVNPEIVCKEGEIRIEEGCLSVPDLRETVARCSRVVVRGLDLEGRSVEVEGEDVMAVALQHEIDHLDGILFLDHLSQLKRSRYVAKRKKVQAGGGS